MLYQKKSLINVDFSNNPPIERSDTFQVLSETAEHLINTEKKEKKSTFSVLTDNLNFIVQQIKELIWSNDKFSEIKQQEYVQSFRVIKTIGKGGYGEVKLGMKEINNTDLKRITDEAIKIGLFQMIGKNGMAFKSVFIPKNASFKEVNGEWNELIPIIIAGKKFEMNILDLLLDSKKDELFNKLRTHVLAQITILENEIIDKNIDLKKLEKEKINSFKTFDEEEIKYRKMQIDGRCQVTEMSKNNRDFNLEMCKLTSEIAVLENKIILILKEKEDDAEKEKIVEEYQKEINSINLKISNLEGLMKNNLDDLCEKNKELNKKLPSLLKTIAQKKNNFKEEILLDLKKIQKNYLHFNQRKRIEINRLENKYEILLNEQRRLDLVEKFEMIKPDYIKIEFTANNSKLELITALEDDGEFDICDLIDELDGDYLKIGQLSIPEKYEKLKQSYLSSLLIKNDFNKKYSYISELENKEQDKTKFIDSFRCFHIENLFKIIQKDDHVQQYLKQELRRLGISFKKDEIEYITSKNKKLKEDIKNILIRVLILSWNEVKNHVHLSHKLPSCFPINSGELVRSDFDNLVLKTPLINPVLRLVKTVHDVVDEFLKKSPDEINKMSNEIKEVSISDLISDPKKIRYLVFHMLGIEIYNGGIYIPISTQIKQLLETFYRSLAVRNLGINDNDLKVGNRYVALYVDSEILDVALTCAEGYMNRYKNEIVALNDDLKEVENISKKLKLEYSKINNSSIIVFCNHIESIVRGIKNNSSQYNEYLRSIESFNWYLKTISLKNSERKIVDKLLLLMGDYFEYKPRFKNLLEEIKDCKDDVFKEKIISIFDCLNLFYDEISEIKSNFRVLCSRSNTKQNEIIRSIQTLLEDIDLKRGKIERIAVLSASICVFQASRELEQILPLFVELLTVEKEFSNNELTLSEIKELRNVSLECIDSDLCDQKRIKLCDIPLRKILEPKSGKYDFGSSCDKEQKKVLEEAKAIMITPGYEDAIYRRNLGSKNKNVKYIGGLAPDHNNDPRASILEHFGLLWHISNPDKMGLSLLNDGSGLDLECLFNNLQTFLKESRRREILNYTKSTKNDEFQRFINEELRKVELQVDAFSKIVQCYVDIDSLKELQNIDPKLDLLNKILPMFGGVSEDLPLAYNLEFPFLCALINYVYGKDLGYFENLIINSFRRLGFKEDEIDQYITKSFYPILTFREKNMINRSCFPEKTRRMVRNNSFIDSEEDSISFTTLHLIELEKTLKNQQLERLILLLSGNKIDDFRVNELFDILKKLPLHMKDALYEYILPAVKKIFKSDLTEIERYFPEYNENSHYECGGNPKYELQKFIDWQKNSNKMVLEDDMKFNLIYIAIKYCLSATQSFQLSYFRKLKNKFIEQSSDKINLSKKIIETVFSFNVADRKVFVNHFELMQNDDQLKLIKILFKNLNISDDLKIRKFDLFNNSSVSFNKLIKIYHQSELSVQFDKINDLIKNFQLCLDFVQNDECSEQDIRDVLISFLGSCIDVIYMFNKSYQSFIMSVVNNFCDKNINKILSDFIFKIMQKIKKANDNSKVLQEKMDTNSVVSARKNLLKSLHVLIEELIKDMCLTQVSKKNIISSKEVKNNIKKKKDGYFIESINEFLIYKINNSSFDDLLEIMKNFESIKSKDRLALMNMLLKNNRNIEELGLEKIKEMIISNNTISPLNITFLKGTVILKIKNMCHDIKMEESIFKLIKSLFTVILKRNNKICDYQKLLYDLIIEIEKIQSFSVSDRKVALRKFPWSIASLALQQNLDLVFDNLNVSSEKRELIIKGFSGFIYNKIDFDKIDDVFLNLENLKDSISELKTESDLATFSNKNYYNYFRKLVANYVYFLDLSLSDKENTLKKVKDIMNNYPTKKSLNLSEFMEECSAIISNEIITEQNWEDLQKFLDLNLWEASK